MLLFTPTFFLRVSSGTCILCGTSAYTSVSLPFTFQGCKFGGVADWASVYSYVSLPGLGVLGECGFGVSGIPILNIDRFFSMALLRGFERL